MFNWDPASGVPNKCYMPRCYNLVDPTTTPCLLSGFKVISPLPCTCGVFFYYFTYMECYYRDKSYAYDKCIDLFGLCLQGVRFGSGSSPSASRSVNGTTRPWSSILRLKFLVLEAPAGGVKTLWLYWGGAPNVGCLSSSSISIRALFLLKLLL